MVSTLKTFPIDRLMPMAERFDGKIADTNVAFEAFRFFIIFIFTFSFITFDLHFLHSFSNYEIYL